MFKSLIKLVIYNLFLASLFSCTSIHEDELAGKYILISEEEEGCHYLSHKTDTLELSDGRVLSSYNFMKGSEYYLQRKDFNYRLKIRTPENRSSMVFTLRKGLLGKIQIFICTDNPTRYEEI